MSLSSVYPTAPTTLIAQVWGNHNPKLYPGSGRHMGIDLAGMVGTPIYAACAGVVQTVNLVGAHGYGRYVILQHDGFKTLYAHLHKVFATVGQVVSAGLRIGEMGGDPLDSDPIDGASSGPHLHFEVILPEEPPGDFVKTFAGWTVDPFPFLLKRSGIQPTHRATVRTSQGVRIRTQPNITTAARVIGTLSYRDIVLVTEIRPDGNNLWVRLWSLREEWAAARFNGETLLTVEPYTAPIPPEPVSVPETVPTRELDEIAIRLDELEMMETYIRARRASL